MGVMIRIDEGRGKYQGKEDVDECLVLGGGGVGAAFGGGSIYELFGVFANL